MDSPYYRWNIAEVPLWAAAIMVGIFALWFLYRYGYRKDLTRSSFLLAFVALILLVAGVLTDVVASAARFAYLCKSADMRLGEGFPAGGGIIMTGEDLSPGCRGTCSFALKTGRVAYVEGYTGSHQRLPGGLGGEPSKEPMEARRYYLAPFASPRCEIEFTFRLATSEPNNFSNDQSFCIVGDRIEEFTAPFEFQFKVDYGKFIFSNILESTKSITRVETGEKVSWINHYSIGTGWLESFLLEDWWGLTRTAGYCHRGPTLTTLLDLFNGPVS